ncbi:MAG: AAA family ATPase [Candidatus Methanoperedens sp.]
MKFTEFKIKNFKGIEDITINLDKSPNANIYTLVGLNESGKTTILEAINLFNPSDQDISALKLPGATIEDYNSLIPISRRDNFNDTITIEVTLKLDDNDLQKINEFTATNTLFREVKKVDTLKYYRYYRFKDSKFTDLDSRWQGFHGWLKTEPNKNYIFISDELYSKDNIKLARFCDKLIPSILYFPNFLFDFPSKIFLETKEEPTPKEKFYIELIQDILYSLRNNTNIKTHLIGRIKSGDAHDKKSLERLLQLMEQKVTKVVFEAWNDIFKREVKDTKIAIHYNRTSEGLPFLEFDIEAQDGIYNINERSLGFRWFFTFLLFTQFRPFRKDSPKNIIFLFDEPASNLHSSAQQQLLKSFENLGHDTKIIYTTHSHHLINPNWLESTYVVKNEGVDFEAPETYSAKKTNILIESYREFVMRHPDKTDYFQPILDVLDYKPSNLENVPNCVFVEGKNDYYTLAYFNEVIFNNKYELNLAPGAGNLDTLISLYIAWGKKFVILLDSDKEGNIQKSRYNEKFGIMVKQRIHTLQDIDPTWVNKEMEKLFENSEVLTFQQTCYPDSTEYNKTHFNRTIQESLINKRDFNFLEQTKDNIEKILIFLNEEINSST